MRECGRGRKRDAEAARLALLDAAEAVFARQGFAGARVEEIAEEAGYNKALLFHYYQDKLGLYRAVVQRMRDRIGEKFAQIMTPENAEAPITHERVRGFIASAISLSFAYYLDHPTALRILAWEAAEGWPTFEQVARGSEQPPWMECGLAYLRRAQAQGIVRPELDPVQLVLHVMGMTVIYLTSLRRYQVIVPEADLTSPAALAHARQQMVDLIVHGTLTDTEEGDTCG
jgi:TetR/AcrR family transcriptional regulator